MENGNRHFFSWFAQFDNYRGECVYPERYNIITLALVISLSMGGFLRISTSFDPSSMFTKCLRQGNSAKRSKIENDHRHSFR